MAHVPHLYLRPPWPEGAIPLGEGHRHHLRGVLRLSGGDPVTYTDGRGRLGEGRLIEEGVERGAERSLPPPAPRLTVAVAPPRVRDRRRFLVEKLAELGVERVLWLDTRYGEGKVPREERAEAWTIAALEQSRGAFLTEVGGPVTLAELPRPLWVAREGAEPPPPAGEDLVVAVGPEGGWHPEETPSDARAVGLGPRVLRVETAALVAAVLALDRLNRHGKW